ncbi:MAG: hypothetical protein HYW57_03045 [Ignavibacteriales bacterium]|nr:hypothetical protein [Ignavibacteriales bacterium]
MPEPLRNVFVLVVTLEIGTVTLPTGFVVRTVLTPVFALFYDAKTAIVLVFFRRDSHTGSPENSIRPAA